MKENGILGCIGDIGKNMNNHFQNPLRKAIMEMEEDSRCFII